MVSPTHRKLLWFVYGACVLGLGFPAFTGIPVFLGLLSGAVLGGVAWALRARRLTVLSASASALVTTGAALRFITDELGPFTYPVLNPAFWLFQIGWLVLFIGALRFVLGPRVVLAVASVVTLAVFVVGARAITFPFNGYVSVYLLMPTAQQFIAGKPNAGYVHTDVAGDHRILVVTRTSSSGRETYWAWISSGTSKEQGVKRCGGWIALRVPFFTSSDTDWPCFVVDEGPDRPQRNLRSGANVIEFDADDGKRLRVEW